MSVFMVPRDKSPWPTLGPQVCDFIEAYLVFGPGDLLGQPARLDPWKMPKIGASRNEYGGLWLLTLIHARS